MTTRLSFTIPGVPGVELSGNGSRRASWRARRAAVEVTKASAFNAAVSVRNRAGLYAPVFTDEIKLRYVIGWVGYRSGLDFDGAVTSLKPVTDGLEAAGWFRNDRQVCGISIRQLLLKEYPVLKAAFPGGFVSGEVVGYDDEDDWSDDLIDEALAWSRL